MTSNGLSFKNNLIHILTVKISKCQIALNTMLKSKGHKNQRNEMNLWSKFHNINSIFGICIPCCCGISNKYLYLTLVLLVSLMSHGAKADPLDGAERPCLTGTFTDVQNWTHANGSLKEHLDPQISIDLSDNPMAVDQLRLLMTHFDTFYGKQSKDDWDKKSFEGNKNNDDDSNVTMESLQNVVYLSLARNKLYRIPLFYSSSSGISKPNFTRLRYLSFYGNNFGDHPGGKKSNQSNMELTINATGLQEVKANSNKKKDKSNWASDLSQVYMDNLLELDLRKCEITSLQNDTFIHLKSLRRLYLSENNIETVSGNAFNKLVNLVHLDLSYNTVIESRSQASDSITLEKNVFDPLKRLKSLDFSFSKINPSSGQQFQKLASSMERLSICYTKFPSITQGFFSSTSLKFLDITGNIALEALGTGALQGIENTLKILNANRLGIKTTNWIANLTQIKVLSLSENDIIKLEGRHFEKLVNLEILDLMNNRISNWNSPIIPSSKTLTMVRLGGNNLNLMTDTMLKDLSKVRYLGLANNRFVCNCHMRDFVHMAIQNINESTDVGNKAIWLNRERETDLLDDESFVDISEKINYLEVHRYYKSVLENRINYSSVIVDGEFVLPEELNDQMQNFSTILLDFLDEKIICTDPRTSSAARFNNVTCELDFMLAESMGRTTILIIVLVVIAIITVIAVLIFWKWWYVRYFFLMVKNAAILSVMGNANGEEEEEKVFTYDVFVSYCDQDRKWVLEHLLPEVEHNKHISVCLHERDFQVGLSIFENIISSMDRSRTLMMIVSNQFLQSQWCQFEMHLAQHRLLETRREQLILVLLEDIPRRKRPNTLHYLMMTKTYIVWPSKPSDQSEFWKRLQKAIMHGKNLDKCSTA